MTLCVGVSSSCIKAQSGVIINLITAVTDQQRTFTFTDGQTKLLQAWQTQTDKIMKLTNAKLNQGSEQLVGRIVADGLLLLWVLKSTMDRY